MKPQPTSTPALPENCIVVPRKFIDLASTDPVRRAIHGIRIDPGRRELVVTNGAGMAILPIPGTAPVKDGYITPATFAKAKATLKKTKDPLLLDYVVGTLAGIPVDAPDVAGNYPNYAAVIPDHDTAYRIILDPELLLTAACALGFRAEEKRGLQIDFAATAKTAIRLSYGDHHGVIMPTHIEPGKGPIVGLLAKQPAGSAGPEHSGTNDQLTRVTVELHGAKVRIRELEAELQGKSAYKPVDAGQAKDKAPKEQPIATGPPLLTRNEERNGIELRFNGKPDESTLKALQDRRFNGERFRWAPGQPGKPWWIRYSEEAWVFATALAEGRGVTDFQPGEPPVPEPTVPATEGPCHPPTGKDEASPIRCAVIHSGETITPQDPATRLFSGRDAIIPTPAELAAERAAASPPVPEPQRPRRILPDF